MGCGIALIIGVVFIIVFYVARNSVFSGDGKVIFESALTLLASWLITLLGFAMLKIEGYEKKWENKLQRTAAAQAAARTDPTVSFTQLLTLHVVLPCMGCQPCFLLSSNATGHKAVARLPTSCKPHAFECKSTFNSVCTW